MKIAKLAAALLVASTGLSSAATVILQFSSGTATVATGFADASSSAAAGLVWGIIVSNGDSVFTPLSQGFVLTTTTNTGTNGVQIGSSNDYYFGSSILTANQPSGGEAGALGKINQLTAITKGAGATTGAAFALVWFDRNITSAEGTVTGGTKYGLLTDPTFVIPADGATTSFATAAALNGGAANDAIKPSNTVTVVGVPEPSALLLGAIGALGLLRRRRN
ncbi:MAG: PEP-CTERM sorting domain-containing protein [Luteolibacter sp.]|uniref:PEP-CTERM sorting domain-containing protein n=1 Tax=Luteolibacter sp. TaxID=1962973 RepID=UPI0032647E86